jgi:uncharacterized protein with NRDE domain
MCLIALALEVSPEQPLVLVANRDERYARATAPAAEWSDPPGIIAGRDLLGGGTWLGVTREGAWAAVTNFYEAAPPRLDARTRGELVSGFLASGRSPEEFLAEILPAAGEYNGFNLLVGIGAEGWWFSNRGSEGPVRLGAGVYALSNHLLDTPWPKVERAREGLRSLLAADVQPTRSALLDLLHDRTLPAAAATPGLTLRERAFAASFIVTPDFGTRATSALVLEAGGGGYLVERTFPRGAPAYVEVMHAW